MALPEKNDYNSLGGEKTDYSPVADPSTDLSAEELNETRVDVAAMTQTAIRAWCGFTVTQDGYFTPEIGNTEQDYGAVYGRASLYKPSVLRNSQGNYTVTFPSAITDARGNSKSLNIQCCFGNSESIAQSVSAKRESANTVRVAVFDITDGSYTEPGLNEKIFVFIL